MGGTGYIWGLGHGLLLIWRMWVILVVGKSVTVTDERARTVESPEPKLRSARRGMEMRLMKEADDLPSSSEVLGQGLLGCKIRSWLASQTMPVGLGHLLLGSLGFCSQEAWL